jgi:hypothetical protein
MKMSELIAKATEGALSQEELNQAVLCLQTGTCDTYQALLVIGRAGAVQYRKLVEDYLSASNAPMMARLALLVLCDYWGLAAEYKPVLEMFARKVEWDDEGDVRLLAINITGRLLTREDDVRLLCVLLDVFDDESESAPQILRESAYRALGLVSGKKREELPPASRHFDLERDVDPEVLAFIAAARSRCRQERQKAQADPP